MRSEDGAPIPLCTHRFGCVTDTSALGHRYSADRRWNSTYVDTAHHVLWIASVSRETIAASRSGSNPATWVQLASLQPSGHRSRLALPTLARRPNVAWPAPAPRQPIPRRLRIAWRTGNTTPRAAQFACLQVVPASPQAARDWVTELIHSHVSLTHLTKTHQIRQAGNPSAHPKPSTHPAIRRLGEEKEQRNTVWESEANKPFLDTDSSGPGSEGLARRSESRPSWSPSRPADTAVG